MRTLGPDLGIPLVGQANTVGTGSRKAGRSWGRTLLLDVHRSQELQACHLLSESWVSLEEGIIIAPMKHHKHTVLER